MAKLHADLEPNRAKLRKSVFDLIYSDFAATTKDIADSLDIGRTDAKKLCDELRDANLIEGSEHDNEGGIGTGRNARRFNSLMWQCRNTYDTTSETEHDREYYAVYPNEAPAQPKPEVADVFVLMPKSGKFVAEQTQIPTARAEAMLEDLKARGWTAEIRFR
jgi:hypothetical protein